jgi:hypothetical protein
MELTGSDAAYENGKVDWPNVTFSAMVRCLLYSAGLSAIFWSAALVHAVYLNNCMYHKVLRHTPHETWTGEKPPLAHLCSFSALVTARELESGLPRLIVIPLIETYWVMTPSPSISVTLMIQRIMKS